MRLGEPYPLQLRPLTSCVVLETPSSGSTTRKLTPALPRPSLRHIAVVRSFKRFRYACFTSTTRPALASIRLETSAAHKSERLESSRDLSRVLRESRGPHLRFWFNSVQDLAHPFTGFCLERPSRPPATFTWLDALQQALRKESLLGTPKMRPVDPCNLHFKDENPRLVQSDHSRTKPE